ncbi:MAG: threonine synthase [Bacteroidetes bacterium]|nr:threonine synthase [Bacteroidota bacterium]
MNNSKFYYKCVDCGATYDKLQVMYLCPMCDKLNSPKLPPKGVLKTVFDYQKLINSGIDFAKLSHNNFMDLMPFKEFGSLPNLRIGRTPLYNYRAFGSPGSSYNIFLKDDSQNPTYSFKDRASSVVSAYAMENDIDTIITASTGNAGSSLAGICAAQGQKAIIIVPESAPAAKLTQILMYGATIIPVKGTYDDAFDLSIKATKEFGWYNRNTAFNPLTIEGKKTVSFELFEQLNYTVPDRIFIPVGDGVIISGVYKGFEDLLNLKIIDHIPTIVAVQSEKSDNLVRNIGANKFMAKACTTIADSISVDIPRNFYMAQKYIQEYNGETITVSDAQIMEASLLLSQSTGLFTEPAAAAAYAGLLTYESSNNLSENSNNVVLLTGSGLKDLKAVSSVIEMPNAIEPIIDELKKFVP